LVENEKINKKYTPTEIENASKLALDAIRIYHRVKDFHCEFFAAYINIKIVYINDKGQYIRTKLDIETRNQKSISKLEIENSKLKLEIKTRN